MINMREFVFGVNDNKFLPKNISLEDLWIFARQFADGDEMIKREEYTDFINKIQLPKKPRHKCFNCSFPDTFILSDGLLTSWWAPGPGDTFLARKVSEPAWECMNDVMKGNWRALPAHSKYTKRGSMKNWAVQWHIEDNEFRAKVLNHQNFTMLSKKQAVELKSTVGRGYPSLCLLRNAGRNVQVFLFLRARWARSVGACDAVLSRLSNGRLY